MKHLKYLVFLIYNLGYKDGYNKDFIPFNVIAAFMVYEIFLLIIVLACIEAFTDIHISILHVKTGFGAIFFLIIYPINHYYFITKGGFDTIYNDYKTAKMNTKRNRIIYGTILILILVTLFVLICNLKSLLS